MRRRANALLRPTRVRGDASAPRVVIVTNIPVPYRLPVYELLNQSLDLNLRVIYCAATESNRGWSLPIDKEFSTVLRPRVFRVSGRYIHVNLGVIGVLRRLRPDVIITTGYNPTHLLAFGFAVVMRIPHVVQTDGTLASERSLTKWHRRVRRFVAKRSAAFVGASTGSQRLLLSQGVTKDQIFWSPLVTDNSLFAGAVLPADKDIDFLFCGRLEPVKNPLFALEVANKTAHLLGRRLSIAFVGSGSLANALADKARSTPMVDVILPGFAQPADLPTWYARSRIFLFPTSWDPWGVVANEAAAAGLPIISTAEAGAVGDIIVDDMNGYVTALDADHWARRCATLLTDPETYGRLSSSSEEVVRSYTFQQSADGLRHAALHARAKSTRGGPLGGAAPVEESDFRME